jgi:hypothetical protein
MEEPCHPLPLSFHPITPGRWAAAAVSAKGEHCWVKGGKPSQVPESKRSRDQSVICTCSYSQFWSCTEERGWTTNTHTTATTASSPSGRVDDDTQAGTCSRSQPERSYGISLILDYHHHQPWMNFEPGRQMEIRWTTRDGDAGPDRGSWSWSWIICVHCPLPDHSPMICLPDTC